MKALKTLCVAAMVNFAVLTSVGQPKAPPPTYAVIDLGTLGGIQSTAYAINNLGQVVGIAYTTSGSYHAFLYQNGAMQDLGTFGQNGAYAYAINSNGQIVIDTDAAGEKHPVYLYQNGTQTLVEPNGFGSAINSKGQIAGYDINGGNGFLWSNGQIQSLMPSSGHTKPFVYGVNDAGVAVGYEHPASSLNTYLACYWPGGTAVELNTLISPSSGWKLVTALGINNAGAIVGSGDPSSDNIQGRGHPFMYNNGSVQDLGIFYGPSGGAANAVNNNGQVVGNCGDASGAMHAFLNQNNNLYDLNSLLLNANSGWVLQEAYGINDNGQIVGFGTNPQGKADAFLLNPYLNLTYVGYKQGDAGVSGSGVPIVFGNPDASGDPNDLDANGRAYTIDYGCALCSLASLLTSLPGLESTSPAELDAALAGVQNGYNDGDDLNWRAVSSAIKYPPLDYPDGGSEEISDPMVLEQFLDDHCWGDRYRVMIKFEVNGDPKKNHFVLVVGRTSNDWIVFDPGWKHAYVNGVENDAALSSLNAHFAGFTTYSSKTGAPESWQFAVEGVRSFKINAPTGGNLTQVVHSPVELLTTDPEGRRVGYDPVSGTNVFEIPGATYIKDYALVDADENNIPSGDTNGVKAICVPSPLGGNYSTVLTGIASGSYTFDSSVYWPGSAQSNRTTTGTTGVGIMTTNSTFVVVPPVISAASVTNSTFSLSFTSQTNVAYVLEGENSLTGTNWSALQTVTAGNTNATFIQPMIGPIMFYRVRSQ